MCSLMSVLLEMAALFSFALLLYCYDWENLSGAWILDDKGTITMNPVVLEDTPWAEVWARDFWGHDQLTDSDSHKSWRPLCTATYRINHHMAQGADAFWFHLTDRVLHAVVAALALPVAIFSLGAHLGTSHRGGRGLSSSFLAAALFTAHPIHVEAVANTTGRAEVLCALFYFSGFLIYATLGAGCSVMHQKKSSGKNNNECSQTMPAAKRVVGHWRGLVAVLLMLFCTWCSMLCKEHGITLPVICAIWDVLLATTTSLPELVQQFNFLGSNAVFGSNAVGKSELSSIVNGSPPAATDESSAVAAGNSRTLAASSRQCDLTPQRQRQQEIRLMLLRVATAAVGTVALLVWRLSKNGDGVPDFSCEQNHGACFHGFKTSQASFSPPACSPSSSSSSSSSLPPLLGGVEAPLVGGRLGRFWHYSWLWCFNFKLLLMPTTLSPDWSGPSIPLLVDPWAAEAADISHIDPRALALPFLYLALASVMYQSLSAVCGNGAWHLQQTQPPPPSSSSSSFVDPSFAIAQRVGVLGAWWVLLTFVLSSNLFLYVGFVVADRTLFLPSFGFCLLLAQILASPSTPAIIADTPRQHSPSSVPGGVFSSDSASEETREKSNSSSSSSSSAANMQSKQQQQQQENDVEDQTQSLSSTGASGSIPTCQPLPPKTDKPNIMCQDSPASPTLSSTDHTLNHHRWWRQAFGLGVGVCVLAAYSVQTKTQAARWADPVDVWGQAYRVNKGSCIIGTELGMSLTNAARPLDAVEPLWEAHRRELEHPLWFTRSIRSEHDRHAASIAMHAAAQAAAEVARNAFQQAAKKNSEESMPSSSFSSSSSLSGGITEDERREKEEEKEEEEAAVVEAAAKAAALEAQLAFPIWDSKLAHWERMAEVFKTRFKLVTALANSGGCDRARPLIEEALAMLTQEHLRAIDARKAEVALDFEEEEKTQQESPGSSKKKKKKKRQWANGPIEYEKAKGALVANKAYLLVSKSRCGRDLGEMAAAAAQAVGTSPGMAYARSHAEAVAGVVAQLNAQTKGAVPLSMVAITMVADPTEGGNSQLMHHSYAIKDPSSLVAAAAAAAAAAAERGESGAGSSLEETSSSPPLQKPPPPTSAFVSVNGDTIGGAQDEWL